MAHSVRYRFKNGVLTFVSGLNTIMELLTGTGGVRLSQPLDLNAQLDVNPLGAYNIQEGLNSRYRLVWVAGQRGKPSLNADILNATESTRMIADPDFEVLGTNMTSALSTFNPEGGITITTAGADADQAILCPHLDANQTAWTQITWGTDRKSRWEGIFKTAASIDKAIIWAGLKLTNDPTVATDDNQVFIRYQNAVNSGKFQAVASIAGTDVSHDTGITVAVSTVYHVVIDIGADRRASFYINGALVYQSAALTTAVDLIPYMGVQASGTTPGAKAVTIRGQAISRDAA